MGDISKNFSSQELQCKCGCGFVVIVDSHVERRQLLRDIYRKPIILTSSTRCEKKNKAVGGKPTSSHLTGYADDVSAPTGGERIAIVAAAIEAGYRRIGIDKVHGFIHLDDDPDKLPSLWIY